MTTTPDPWRVIASALHTVLVEHGHEPDNPAAQAYNHLRNGRTDQALNLIRGTGIRYAGLDTGQHILRLTVTDDADCTFTIECPHDHTIAACTNGPHPTPACGEWDAADVCICDCDECTAGRHDNCEQSNIIDIGRQWCQAVPSGQCWYTHALQELGATDLLCLTGPLTAAWPVTLTGCSWDEPIEVTETWTQATEPTDPDPTAALTALTNARRDIDRRISDTGRDMIAGIIRSARPEHHGDITVSRDNNGRILVTARLMDVIVVHPGDKRRPARIIREAVAAILPPPASANIGGCGITRFNIDDHPGDPTPYAGIWNELFVDG